MSPQPAAYRPVWAPYCPEDPLRERLDLQEIELAGERIRSLGGMVPPIGIAADMRTKCARARLVQLDTRIG